jgi:hypothetical protein
MTEKLTVLPEGRRACSMPNAPYLVVETFLQQSRLVNQSPADSGGRADAAIPGHIYQRQANVHC